MMKKNKKEYPKSLKGLSITIAIGAFAKPGVQIANGSILCRICLGWIAITILSYDIEIAMNACLAELEKADKEITELKSIKRSNQ